ncbi:hypothetical protein vseg_003306 [Gypsophila vaccaria]
MEDFTSSRFEGTVNPVRKKRTHTFRRTPESQVPSQSPHISSLSSTPPSHDFSPYAGNASRRKQLSLSHSVSTVPETHQKLDIGLDQLYGNSAEQGHSGSTHKLTRDAPMDGLGFGTVKKVKLKLGGVTRTIDANASSKTFLASDATTSQHKTINKENDDLPHRRKRSGLQGIPWKDFSSAGFSLGRRESPMTKGAGKSGSGKQGKKPDSARRSRRASKKRTSDGFDDDEDDDEIRYLEKLKNARLSSGLGEYDEESSRKHRRLSKFSGESPQNLEGSSSSKSGTMAKDGKKRSSSVDTDYEEDEDILSDGEPDSRKKKRARRELVDSPVEPKRELTLTTRQRALQSSATGGSVVEFPNGLPPATSGKPKEQLTAVEQQLKRAEAAQRRKMQNEKAARESEAEAIRKILGQDSNRKKKEDKKKKRIADLAQEKAADELMRASNTVRLTMGPNGTTVTFPNEMGLPSLFASGPCRYPPPREKCAGPSCSNPYKYRDSKTKLPLCSLQCYKAVQGSV